MLVFPGDMDIVAGIMLYALRMNNATKTKVENIMRDAMSQHCDFDPQRTIAMPIRGSDKCFQYNSSWWETWCLDGFDKYMEIAEHIRKYDPKVDTIILTSEDDRFFKEVDRYTADGRWRFIVNPYDDHPGTGAFHEASLLEGFTPERFQLSVMSTLHLLLNGKYLIYSSQSNFHRLLYALAGHGRCAAAGEITAYDLSKQYADYKICLKDDGGCLRNRNDEVVKKYGFLDPISDTRRTGLIQRRIEEELINTDIWAWD